MPGIGNYSALLITTEIGDVNRFPNVEKLCNYAGLVPSISQSARTLRRGHITKEGNKLLRWILVECAHRAIVSNNILAKKYKKLENKIGRNKAIVSIARKMLCYAYIILTEGKEWSTLNVNTSEVRS